VRLPTAEEWEKAARGTDGRAYSYGDHFDVSSCNTAESRLGGPTRVDRYPGGASPFGAQDMTGNVWEWVRAARDRRPTIKGGAFESAGSLYGLTFMDMFADPAFRRDCFGFRVARG